MSPIDNKLSSIIKEWIFPLVTAVVVALVINKTLFFMAEIPTTSMYPLIKPGDRLLVTKVYNKDALKKGDVVLFESKELNEVLAKRLIGLPGDEIEIKTDGSVFINGSKTEEEYVKKQGSKPGSFKVPEKSFFFLGDNRKDSLDSRYWENPYIDQSDVIGKARFILYPFNRINVLK